MLFSAYRFQDCDWASWSLFCTNSIVVRAAPVLMIGLPLMCIFYFSIFWQTQALL